ncbi:putative OBP32pep [Senna tora]|uniref:Putative OBP32pep n=1 Tax=Senna tora TaxID=362788 RepID=A0A834WSE5_9FABA|nr:putative OBP32pep [Senna tora]
MMGESDVTKSRLNVNKNEKGGFSRALNPAISTFFVQLPHKFQNILKSQLSRLAKNDGNKWVNSVHRNKSESFSTSEAELDEQLKAWKENPSWADNPPKIKVTVPKGSLCNLDVEVDVGLPPDAVYNIVTDPDNKRVFKNIKEVLSRKVLVDEGQRQVVDLEQAALWRFLWWSGTISVHVLVDQNREDHSMKFKQVKSGFMKRFEGCWRVEPLFVDEKTCYPFKPRTKEGYNACTKGKGRIGSKVSLQQILEPAIVPPPPISWYLRGITSRTTEMLINDLLAETARIRGGFEAEMSKGELQETSDKIQDLVGCTNDIKERWILRRKNAKQNQRRLLTAK